MLQLIGGMRQLVDETWNEGGGDGTINLDLGGGGIVSTPRRVFSPGRRGMLVDPS